MRVPILSDSACRSELLIEPEKTLSKRNFYSFDYLRKGGSIAHCHFGKCLTIQIDIGFFQTGDKLTITES